MLSFCAHRSASEGSADQPPLPLIVTRRTGRPSAFDAVIFGGWPKRSSATRARTHSSRNAPYTSTAVR